MRFERNPDSGRPSRSTGIIARWSWLGMIVLVLSACGGSAVFTDCDSEGICEARVEVVKYSGSIPLAPDSAFWNSDQGPAKVTVDLGPQLITNPQWPNPSIKQVTVSAARTETEMAVRLEWQDGTRNSNTSGTSVYTDQAAVLFPLDRNAELPPITMGGEDGVVNIWIWKAARDPALRTLNPEEPESLKVKPVDDLNAEGFSTLTRQAEQNVEGQGGRSASGWQVVFKRPLQDGDENDAQFVGSTPMAIAVWDGGNRETNGQKGISPWIFLKFI